MNIHYLWRLIPFVLVFLLRYPLAFFAVAFAGNSHILKFGFKWLDTIDNDDLGDQGWKDEHIISSNPDTYINRVRWIWRNGGNRFNYFVIGVPSENRPAWAFWSKSAIPLWPGRFLDVRYGWSDYNLEGRCKFVLTFRGKTKA